MQARHTNPVDVLSLVQSIGGRLDEQRRLAHARGPIHFRHLASRISARDWLARQARRGQQLVELPEARGHSAAAASMEALEGL